MRIRIEILQAFTVYELLLCKLLEASWCTSSLWTTDEAGYNTRETPETFSSGTRLTHQRLATSNPENMRANIKEMPEMKCAVTAERKI